MPDIKYGPTLGVQEAPPPYQQYHDPPPAYTPSPPTIQPPSPGTHPTMYQQQRYNCPAQYVYLAPPEQYTTPVQYQARDPVVMVSGQLFDRHARFDGIAQPCIPPPPPGIPPNAVQMMAAQGIPVKIDLTSKSNRRR